MGRIRILLFALLCLSTEVARSDSGVAERLYISTDKYAYVAGDKVWCSLYNFQLADSLVSLSDFSSTAYLELQSNDQVVLTAKVGLSHGRGAGAIQLPVNLPTGNYRLVGYTSQNKNEKSFKPYGNVISVFNVLSSERDKGGVKVYESEVKRDSAHLFVPPQNSPQLCVDLPSASVGVGDEFNIRLFNSAGSDLFMNMSIFHKDKLVNYSELSLLSFVNNLQLVDPGEVTYEFTPDYEGEVIQLQVSGAEDGRVYVSFPGAYGDYYVADVAEDGRCKIVTPNIYGDRDLICQGGESVMIVDPFIRDICGEIYPLELTPDLETSLLDRSFSVQLETRFDSDTLYEMLPVRRNGFLDDNKIVYWLDDYTRFPKMEEVITEYVREITFRNSGDQRRLAVLIDNTISTYYAVRPSLVMLDGVPIMDHSRIIQYDPLLVERIEIYTGVFSVGDAFYEGVANFITYKGDLSGLTFGKDIKMLSFKGPLYPMSFTGKSIRKGGGYPDFRQTIYWNPVMELPAGNEDHIRCIAPLYPGEFELVIEGVTSLGEPVYYREKLEVR